ncbi:MAG: 2-hydroxyacid dehydrogenase [Cellulomonas sp.]
MTSRRIVCPSADGGLAARFASPDLRRRLDALGEVAIATDVPDQAGIRERVSTADVVLLSVHLDDDTLRACAGRTELVAFSGTGAASYVNLGLARELGITVTNVTHYGDRAVAEHALALLLAAARGVPAADRALRTGDWSGHSGRELEGATVGVVGFGGIGRTFARLVDALGMRVLAWDRALDEADLQVAHARAAGLDELFAASDVVSLHLPLTEHTAGIVTERMLGLLRPGAILVNTARGELLAPGALARRLGRGDLLAALDVFDPEPLGADDPLLTAPGTVLTPHLGFRTPQALSRMAEGAVAAVEAFCAGRPVNVVT